MSEEKKWAGYASGGVPGRESTYAIEESASRPIEKRGISPETVEQATIRVRAPGENWWYGGWFVPPQETQLRSREALHHYRLRFDQRNQTRGLLGGVPWRFRRSPSTGLPMYLRGWLEAPPESLKDAVRQSLAWIEADPDLQKALSGQDVWGTNLKAEDKSNRYAERASRTSKLDRELRSYHVRLGQRYQELPVFGGQWTVHTYRQRAWGSVSSTYMPIPEGMEFHPDQAIKDSAAFHSARQALRHFAEVTPEIFGPALHGGAHNAGSPDDPHAMPPPAEWHARIVPYEGSCLFVLPFAGEYVLAFRVHLTSPDQSETWSVFVDARTGKVLGQPGNLARHMVFAGSAEAASGGPPSLDFEPTDNPCKDYMCIVIAKDGGAPTDICKPAWTNDPSSHEEFEAINVAYHAHKLFKYLITDTITLPADAPRLKAQVVKTTRTKPQYGFNSDTHVITFWHKVKEGQECDPTAEQCMARDPEVIYHEITHGLMYLMNGDPFEHQVEAAPFAEALVEGYANYLARSLGAKDQVEVTAHWAAAAFRPEKHGDRWALFRDKKKPGQDVLSLPNLYPTGFTKGLKVYDVGMVWARALWDLRALAGPDIVDPLALQAYHHARGWVTSFESTAEGLVEAVLASPDIAPHDALQVLVAGRLILAEQGIQCLAVHGQTILAGADEGLLHSDDGGATWDQDDLEDVIALAVDRASGTLYAATETGIFERKAGGWERFAGEPEEQRPLSLAIDADGRLYVGTGQGVRRLHKEAGSLFVAAHNPSAAHLPFDGLALGMAVDASGALYVAAYDFVQVRSGEDDAPWIMIELEGSGDHHAICVTTTMDRAFVGTDDGGIWQLMVNGVQISILEPVAAASELGEGAVLCLARAPGAGADNSLALVAGTTEGVYQGAEQNGGWAWQRLEGLPDDVMVTALAATETCILAGTALHGLWCWDGDHWTLVREAQSIAGASIPSIGHATSPLILDVVPEDEGEPVVHLVPFSLTQSATLHVLLSSPIPVELWSLGANVRRLAEGAGGRLQKPGLLTGFYVLVTRKEARYTATLSIT